jgi:hypothetical protein
LLCSAYIATNGGSPVATDRIQEPGVPTSGKDRRESAYAALAAEVEALVDQLQDECERGVVSQTTADELSALVDRTRRLSTAPQD